MRVIIQMGGTSASGMTRLASRVRQVAVSVTAVVVLSILAWEWSFDLNDPTIPVVREFLFTAGSIFGIAAFLIMLLDGR